MSAKSILAMLALASQPAKAMSLEQAITIGPLYRAGTYGCYSRTGRPGHGCAHQRRRARKAAGVRKHRQRMGMKP